LTDEIGRAGVSRFSRGTGVNGEVLLSEKETAGDRQRGEEVGRKVSNSEKKNFYTFTLSDIRGEGSEGASCHSIKGRRLSPRGGGTNNLSEKTQGAYCITEERKGGLNTYRDLSASPKTRRETAMRKKQGPLHVFAPSKGQALDLGYGEERNAPRRGRGKGRLSQSIRNHHDSFP